MPFLLAVSAPSESAVQSARARHRTHLTLTQQLVKVTGALCEALQPNPLQLETCRYARSVVALVAATDAKFLSHASKLSTESHRLLADVFWQHAVPLNELIWADVLAAALLAEPVRIEMHHGLCSGPQHSFFSLPEFIAQRVLAADVIYNGRRISARELLQTWQVIDGLRTKGLEIWSLSCLQLPHPLPHLLGHGLWSCVAFRFSGATTSRRARGYLGLGKAGEAEAQRDQAVEAQPEAMWSASYMFAEAAKLLRDPLLQDVDDSLDNVAGKQAVIAWLGRMADHASHGQRQLMHALSHRGGRGGAVWQSQALVQCILLCDLFRSDAALRDALGLAVRLLLPGDSDLIKSITTGSYALPSKSVVSRYRLNLDVAYMRVVSQYFQKVLDTGSQMAIYLLADSSPRAGKDWLLAEMFVAKLADLHALADAQDQIINLAAEQKRRRDEASAATALSLGDDDDEGDPSTEHLNQLTEQMHGVLWHHYNVPTVLGLGEMSRTQKLVALIHSLRMELGSWAALKSVVSSVVAFTTDYGTESGLTSIAAVNCNELFPHWSENQIGDDDAWDPAGAQPGNAALVSFCNALPVPGCLHILHNALSDMGPSLPGWAEWLSKAKCVASYLSHGATKDLLLQRCFSTEPAVFFSKHIRAFRAEVYDKRFGSLMHFLNLVLPLRGALTQHFDLEALRTESKDDSPTADVNAVAEAVRSPFWWSYGQVVQTASAVIYELECWVSSCPCHPSKVFGLCGADSYYRRRRAYMKSSGISSTCPAKGCVAPWLATGHVKDVLEGAKKVYSGMLLQEFAMVSEREREQLLEAWTKAQQYVDYVITLKFSLWSGLPWLLCGLGHPDVGKARQAAKNARSEWARTSGHTDAHHPLTLRVFADPALSAQLDDFADCEDSRLEGALRDLAVQLRFVRCNEQSVERIHKMATLTLARNPSASGPYISMGLGRQHEIVKHVLSSEGGRECLPQVASSAELVEALDATRSLPRLMDLLGLSLHPTWTAAPDEAAYEGRGLRRSMAHRICASIIYRYDKPSMFNPRKSLKDAASKDAARKASRHQASLPEATLQFTSARGPGDVMAMAAFMHFRELCDTSTSASYTMPLLPEIASLGDALRGGSAAQGSTGVLEPTVSIVEDVAISGYEANVQQKMATRVYGFRVTHAAPNRQRRFRPVGDALRNDHMVVAPLSIVGGEKSPAAGTTIVASPAGDGIASDVLSMRSFVAAGYDALRAKLIKWTPAEYRFRLDTALPNGISPDDLQGMVTEMMRVGAHHGGGDNGLLPSQDKAALWRPCVDFLKGRQLLTESEGGMLRLTALALEAMEAIQVLTGGVPVLKRRSGLPLESWTLWELADSLAEQGWTALPCPRDSPTLMLPEAGDLEAQDKVWYYGKMVANASALRLYLRCLASWRELRDDGLPYIMHGRAKDYYVQLLAGAVPEPAAIHDDIAEQAPVLAIEDASEDEDVSDLADPELDGLARCAREDEDNAVHEDQPPALRRPRPAGRAHPQNPCVHYGLLTSCISACAFLCDCDCDWLM